MEWFEGFEMSKSITKVKLYRIPIEGESIKKLLQSNETLLHLELRLCGLSGSDIERICSGLSANQTLESLSLKHNAFNQVGFRYIWNHFDSEPASTVSQLCIWQKIDLSSFSSDFFKRVIERRQIVDLELNLWQVQSQFPSESFSATSTLKRLTFKIVALE
jgi:hypothetical protein